MFGAHVLLLVRHHKDVLFAIVEEVYGHDQLEKWSGTESGYYFSPIRVVFISLVSFNGPSSGLGRLPGSEPSGRNR
jgi:hypothetical protein